MLASTWVTLYRGIGVLVGAIAHYSTSASGSPSSVYFFAPEAFFFVMLPPIIFDAGLTLNKVRKRLCFVSSFSAHCRIVSL